MKLSPCEFLLLQLCILITNRPAYDIHDDSTLLFPSPLPGCIPWLYQDYNNRNYRECLNDLHCRCQLPPAPTMLSMGGSPTFEASTAPNPLSEIMNCTQPTLFRLDLTGVAFQELASSFQLASYLPLSQEALLPSVLTD